MFWSRRIYYLHYCGIDSSLGFSNQYKTIICTFVQTGLGLSEFCLFCWGLGKDDYLRHVLEGDFHPYDLPIFNEKNRVEILQNLIHDIRSKSRTKASVQSAISMVVLLRLRLGTLTASSYISDCNHVHSTGSHIPITPPRRVTIKQQQN